ncbi:MAG: trypsin-like peptidase domain-containing protein [Erysipelotrichales bacterium]|nr:trypsin-like peptidase domain-containing protein [Erysipelotrichales bacterium]
MEKKRTSGIQFLIIFAIIILIIVAVFAAVLNYVPIEDIFKTEPAIKTNVKKEVTVTDEGIADAVEKLYDATVIVKVGNNNQITGWGSGFVYKDNNKDAYILTNHHVVDGSNTITIEMSDGSTTTGSLVGSDEFADVAVIKVASNTVLSVAEIGESESLRVGDTVFAVGTPVSLDYSFTVTRGILSGKDRLVERSNSSSDFGSFFNRNTATETWYMKLLQIDASINSGNSGGPLANCNGEVVGINNSKISSSYSSTSIENIGFAIPIEDALEVAENIEKGKNTTSTKPTLGVTMTTIEGASQNNIKVDEGVKTGAVIVSVVEKSNADNAGLKAGDVITKYNDIEIKDYRYLKYYLYKSSVGDKVKITYIRDGKEHTTDVTLKG